MVAAPIRRRNSGTQDLAVGNAHGLRNLDDDRPLKGVAPPERPTRRMQPVSRRGWGWGDAPAPVRHLTDATFWPFQGRLGSKAPRGLRTLRIEWFLSWFLGGSGLLCRGLIDRRPPPVHNEPDDGIGRLAPEAGRFACAPVAQLDRAHAYEAKEAKVSR